MLKVKSLINSLMAAGILCGIENAHAALSKKVIGDLVFWDQSRGYQDIQTNIDVFSEVSPFWYYLNSDGTVSPYRGSVSSYEDPAIVSYLHSQRVLVLPTVTNLINGAWNGALVSNVINSSLTTTNINALVNLVLNKGYDGIDLDYEDLAATDKVAFSSFVTQLASALHAKGKILSVNVYGKTSDPGTWSGPQAQDYAVLGQAADEIRIMMYEYHWATSAAGPIAPINWANDVLTFAKTKMAASKIIQGIPLYGYDWVGTNGAEHVWQELQSIASTNNATINWDSASASPYFAYAAANVQHTAWFENAQSCDAKLAQVNSSGIGGIFLWRLGGQDPGVWPAIRNRFASTSTLPDTKAPNVIITSPMNGSRVSKKLSVSAAGSDNIGVIKMNIIIDGKVYATVAANKYSASISTTTWSAGMHTIKVVAFDAAGNSGSVQISVSK